MRAGKLTPSSEKLTRIIPSSLVVPLQVHHVVLALFLGGRVPQVRPGIPRSHLVGFRQPLHAHVLVSVGRGGRSIATSVVPQLIIVRSSRRRPSSLATGSASHKTVTSEVSRILWYYYNDSVGGRFQPLWLIDSPLNPLASLSLTVAAHALLCLLLQRALLRVSLPEQILLDPAPP